MKHICREAINVLRGDVFSASIRAELQAKLMASLHAGTESRQ